MNSGLRDPLVFSANLPIEAILAAKRVKQQKSCHAERSEASLPPSTDLGVYRDSSLRSE
jgi:hypothetical protein